MNAPIEKTLDLPASTAEVPQERVLDGTFFPKAPKSLAEVNGFSPYLVVDVPFGGAALRLGLMDAVLFPKFPPQVHTDVAIVEGAGVLSFPVAHAAYVGFMSGKYEHMLLVGGHELDNNSAYKRVAAALKVQDLPAGREGETEAAYMGRHLKGMGVPSDRFTVLEATTPTLDWLGQALFLPALQGAKSVNLIGVFPSRNHMMLRYLRPHLTLTQTNVVPFDEFSSSDDAHMSWIKTAASYFVWEQLERAEKEVNQGLYPAVDFSKEIERARRLPPARPPLDSLRMIGPATVPDEQKP